MAKFCDTRFAQSKLMVYKNFENNYNIYRRTWSGDAEAEEPEQNASTVAAATKATIKQAPIATASAIEEATSTKAATASTSEQLKQWLL